MNPIIKNADKPAFPPRFLNLDDPSTDRVVVGHPQHGMSKREYFAGLAMQGLMSQGYIKWDGNKFIQMAQIDEVSEMAVSIADGLLKQLEA